MDKNTVDKSFEKNIQRPTLFIWGTEDPVIVPEIIPLQKVFMQAPYEELSVKSGHSLLQAKTDTIITAILNHFGK